MAYDAGLAQRIREALDGEPDVSEKRMFGGIAFLLGGNMVAGVVGEDLMVRVGPAEHAAALREKHARAMDFTGRPMKGFVFVAPRGYDADADLARWLDRGARYARSLPAK